MSAYKFTPKQFLTSILDTIPSCSEWVTLLRDYLGFSTAIDTVLPCGATLPALLSQFPSPMPEVPRPPTPPEQRRDTSPFAFSPGLSTGLAPPSPPLGGQYVGVAPPPQAATSSKKRVRSDSNDQEFFEGEHLPSLCLPLLKHVLSCESSR